MIRLIFVLAVSVSFANVSNAQESPVPTEKLPPATRPASATQGDLQQLRTSSGKTYWVIRQQYELERARARTGRAIEFRSGDYWVDNRSRLVDSAGRDCGFWGIDSFNRQIFR